MTRQRLVALSQQRGGADLPHATRHELLQITRDALAETKRTLLKAMAKAKMESQQQQEALF
jgi:hypothetical protein